MDPWAGDDIDLRVRQRMYVDPSETPPSRWSRPGRRWDPEADLPSQVLAAVRPSWVVSQGTVDNADQDKLVVPALTGLSDQPDVVVATAGGVATECLRTRFPAGNVVIEDVVNYTDLSPHADVVVTSGGYGSTVAALRHGVRVVGAGKREGKNDINARVGYNKLGVDPRTDRPGPARIRADVHRVLPTPRSTPTSPPFEPDSIPIIRSWSSIRRCGIWLPPRVPVIQ